MKKKVLIIIIFILLVIMGVLLIKIFKINNEVERLKLYNTTGYYEYDLGNAPDGNAKNTLIKIPADLIYVETCCAYGTTFASFKDVDVLKEEVEEILNTYYKKIKEDDKTIYFDEENNFAITDYSITEGSIVNYVTYGYE